MKASTRARRLARNRALIDQWRRPLWPIGKPPKLNGLTRKATYPFISGKRPLSNPQQPLNLEGGNRS